MPKIYVYSKEALNLKEVDTYQIVYFKAGKELLDIDSDDIFISYAHDTPLAFRLEKYQIPAENLAISTMEEDLETVLAEVNEETNYRRDYSIFSGDMISAIDREIKVDILKSLRILIQCIYQMLEAGYLEMQNKKKIDDWILSFEEPTLKIFKIYHQIETSNPSIDIEEEFLINPAYRRMILLMMMKIIANFIINNNMITVDKVAELGSWEREDTWLKMKEQVKLLNL